MMTRGTHKSMRNLLKEYILQLLFWSRIFVFQYSILVYSTYQPLQIAVDSQGTPLHQGRITVGHNPNNSQDFELVLSTGLKLIHLTCIVRKNLTPAQFYFQNFTKHDSQKSLLLYHPNHVKTKGQKSVPHACYQSHHWRIKIKGLKCIRRSLCHIGKQNKNIFTKAKNIVKCFTRKNYEGETYVSLITQLQFPYFNPTRIRKIHIKTNIIGTEAPVACIVNK